MMSLKNKIEDVRAVFTEKIGQGVLRVRLADNRDANQLIGELHALFDDVFKTGTYQIIFDMGNVELPNGSFIAMLIGRTMEARRWGGDIKIINLSQSARNHFTIFTPLTYLSIGFDEISNVDTSSLKTDLKEGKEETPVDFVKGRPCRLEIESSINALHRVSDFVAELGKKAGLEQIELSKLKIAVYEVCMNVIEHGYCFEPGNFIGIEVLWEDKKFQITVTDHGESFDFYDVKPYNVEDAFQEKRQGGFGLYIIKRSVDEIA